MQNKNVWALAALASVCAVAAGCSAGGKSNGSHTTGPNGANAGSTGQGGGNGDTGNEDRQLSVMPLNVRYVANAIGHYKFSDAADFFFEAKYARTH